MEYDNAVTMRAIGITARPEIGKVADILEMLEVSVPLPAKDEVAIKLVASSIHIDEIYAAQGTALGRFYGSKNLSKSNPRLLGSSVSGTVVGLGENVQRFRLEDEVVAIPNHQLELGSWATYRCVNEDWIVAKPAELSHVESAAATMAACVAWSAVCCATAKAGSRCAVVGASGAVGSMVLQYLKSLDCYVTAVCSRANYDLARELGADEVVAYDLENFSDAANSKGQSFDAVIDCVGGIEIERSAFDALNSDGIFVTVVGPVKHIGEQKLSWTAFVKLMAHIVCRFAATRIFSGPRYTFGAKYPRLVIHNAMKQLVNHDIRMPVASTVQFSVAEIADAVRQLQTHRAKGRYVIDFGESRHGN